MACFISVLFICQLMTDLYTNDRETDLKVDKKSDAVFNTQEETGISENRASFDYQEDTSIPFRWEEPFQGAARIPFSYSGHDTLNLGFDFDFYGQTYSTINVFTHGYASFTSTYSSTSGPQFPSGGSNFQKIVSPLWNYVYYWSTGPTAGIYHKRLQDPKRYVITWNQAPYSNGASTFQIVLYKDNGNILFNYQNVCNNARPTVGLNDGDGVHFNMPYYSNQRPSPSQSIVYGTVNNDVAVDEVLTPEPNTRLKPNTLVYINSSIINYGFNNRNNIPVQLKITCDQDAGYLHENSTTTSGNQGVMETSVVSFPWMVPNIENRDYTISVKTVMMSPPDEVSDGNQLQFRVTGKTYYDVGVWEVERVNGEYYPFMNIPVTARLGNWGNIDTNYSVQMTVNGANPQIRDMPIIRSGGIEGVFEEHLVNVTFHWMVGKPGQYLLTFTTLLDSDENSNNDVSSVTKDVIVSPYDVRMGYNGSTLNGMPNSAISFRITVYNDGQKKDDIRMNVTDYPFEKGWAKPIFDHDVLNSLGRESSREISLIVAVPPRAAAGLISIEIRASSLGDGNTNTTLGLLVNVLPDPNVFVQAPEGRKGLPGGTVMYNFTIFNTGNSVDSFSIITSSTNNWDTRILGSAVTPELEPNGEYDNHTIQIEMTIPEDSLYGSTDILKVTAASLEDIAVQRSAHVDTTVLQHYDIKIRSPINEYAIHTERDIWLSFNVTNTGNGKDDTIDFEVSHPDGWYTYIDDSKLHNGLERLYWGQVFMKVRVPQGTPNDIFPVIVTVLSGEGSLPKDSFEFRFEILPEYGINISSPESLKRSLGEETVSYRIDIRNIGNTEEAFNVSSPSPWIRFRSGGQPLNDLWLGANETRSIEAIVSIPPDTDADSDNGTKELDGYRFHIEVFSSINPNAINDDMFITLLIDPEYDHDLFTPTPTIKVARKGLEQEINTIVYVENTGNTQEIVYLNMEKSEDGPVTAYIRTINVLLAHRETKRVVLTINVNSIAELGTYDIILRSTSSNNNSNVNRISLTIEIVDYDFYMKNVLIDGEEISQDSTLLLKLNQPVSVSVVIGNLGSENFEGLFGENLTVTFYVGTMSLNKMEIDSLEKGNDRQLSFEWIPKVRGDRDFTVKLNEDDSIPESRSDNNNGKGKIKIVSEGYFAQALKKEETAGWIYYGGISLIIVLVGVIILSSIFIFRKGSKKEGYDEKGEYRPEMERVNEEEKEISINIDEWEELYDDEEDGSDTKASEYLLASSPKRAAPAPTGPVMGEALPILPAPGSDEQPNSFLPPGTGIPEEKILELPVEGSSSEEDDIAAQPVMAKPAVMAMPISGPSMETAPVKKIVTKPFGPVKAVEEDSRKITTRPIVMTRSISKPSTEKTPAKKIMTKPLKPVEAPEGDVGKILTRSLMAAPVPDTSKETAAEDEIVMIPMTTRPLDNGDTDDGVKKIVTIPLATRPLDNSDTDDGVKKIATIPLITRPLDNSDTDDGVKKIATIPLITRPLDNHGDAKENLPPSSLPAKTVEGPGPLPGEPEEPPHSLETQIPSSSDVEGVDDSLDEKEIDDLLADIEDI